MARGKYKTQRGGGRHFSARPQVGEEPDESVWAIRKSSEEEENSDSSEEEEEEEEEQSTSKTTSLQGRKGIKQDQEDYDDSDLDSEEEEEEGEKKGTEGLIEVANPNRTPKKAGLKASELVDAPRELSRREREEQARLRAQKKDFLLKKQGRTEEARADLERLRLIRQEREEAARRRAAEAEAKAEMIAAKAKALKEKGSRK
ncbi:MAG: casein kinase substrate phosphoprotein PP28-domain-containing protein [Piptocephalis tieghemiana]|nr:MAG: casein kinase substrate phosphoprotein PP28-domain-containing protein [Piptocephalis tieghemiana]